MATSMEWPRHIAAELDRRKGIEGAILADQERMVTGAVNGYARDLIAFASDCVYLYEPRNANKGQPVVIPAVPFPRQREFLQWLQDCFERRLSAPVEKSRDSGATWMACVFAVWLWRFHAGSTIGFGSRKEMLVDRLGDMQAIFPKIRSIIHFLPPYLVPFGYKDKLHSNYMRIFNPENGSAIIGEAGENIGRGGRTSIYFVDESAYIERPQEIEASLTATTDCRIDISSPKVGTLFQEWCSASPHKFIFDVDDAPWHTPAWKAAKKAELDAKGMGHLFKREYLRDPSAGLTGQVIDSEWVEAAVGAHARMRLESLARPLGRKFAALDVADGGQDTNAYGMRHGPIVRVLEERRDLRADEAGGWAHNLAMQHAVVELRYDAIGVGAGAAAGINFSQAELRKRNITPPIKDVVAWKGSEAVLYPKHPWDGKDGSPTNADMFLNINAQSWWHLRQRFIETYKASIGEAHDPEMVVSLDPSLACLRQVKSELTQVLYKYTANGKIQIIKAPDGMKSPNLADCLKMLFAPQSMGIEIIGLF